MKSTEELKKLRAMKEAELVIELRKVHMEANMLGLSVKAGKSTNSAAVKSKRRQVAKIKTILGQINEK